MATALDDQVAALLAALEHLDAQMKQDVTNWFSLNSWTGDNTSEFMGDNSAMGKPTMIKELQQQLPDVIAPYVQAAGDLTATWYDQLAPDQPYQAETIDPAELINTKKMLDNISWAVNTATTIDTALSQVQKSMQRHVFDASRNTVSHNANQEGVKYLRHTNYAGACNWCLVMASKGAVYKTAAAAVKGHDNCKCIAVPIRKGTVYNTPQMVKDGEAKYVQASAALKAEGKAVTLDSVVAKMDEIDAAGMAPVAKAATDYEKLAPEQKKSVQNSYQGKKNKAKAKFGADSPEYTSLKALGTSKYYDLHYKDEFAAKQGLVKANAKASDATNQAQWLAAEAKFNSEQAIAKATAAEAKATASVGAKKAAFTEVKAAEQAAAQEFSVAQAPAFDTPSPPAIADADEPNWGSFIYMGGAGGSHGAGIWQADQGAGAKFVVKKQNHYKNLLDETTAKLQHKTGLPAPTTWTTKSIPGQGEASVQEYIGKGGNAFDAPTIKANDLAPGDLLELQKNQVFDWLISNHDAHAQQWVRDETKKLVGIDKGQAFKWFGKDKLDWDFHPNKASDEHEPIYNTIWKLGLQGKLEPYNPSVGQLHAYIQGVQSIPDAEYKAMLKPFAEAAAQHGNLVSQAGGHGLLKNSNLIPNDVESFLTHAVARKNNLQNDFDALYAKYKTAKTGVNPMASAPPPASTVTPTVDVSFAEKQKKLMVAKNISAAKSHPNLSDSYLHSAKTINGMTTEEFVGTYPLPFEPLKPAEKALLDTQSKSAQELVDLLDQGAVDPYTLQAGGHVTYHKVQQFDVLNKTTPQQFADAYPEKVAAFAKPQFPGAVQPSDYFKLPPEQKKTVQNSYSGKKNKAKVKFGVDSPEYQELKAMGPDGYYAKVYAPTAKPAPAATTPLQPWEQELIDAAKTGAPAPDLGGGTPAGYDAATDPITVTTANGLAAKYDSLTKDELYKVGNQFSGKKNKAKKGTTPLAKAEQYIYSQWSKKDFWAAQQIQPGGPVAHPLKDIAAKELTQQQANEYQKVKALLDDWTSTHPGTLKTENPYYGVEHVLKWSNITEYKQWLIDHGQTTVLGSPLGGYPKVPGVKITTAKPPINPPTDPFKASKVKDWELAYYKAKPGGTGFNPVKAFNPEGTLKTNLADFDAEIGIGYLTDDQAFQALLKQPKTAQAKYLKKYADAKGQDAADALNLKLNPPESANVISPPTSAGSKPSGPYGGDWKANVQIKPGTNHTPLRENNPLIVKQLANKQTGVNHAIPNPSAPVGSAENPHVFSNQDAEYKTWGALMTEQNQSAWNQTLLKPIKSYTGSAYVGYNEKLRNDLAKLVDEWLDPDTGKPKLDAAGNPLPKPKPTPTVQAFDKAFHAETSKVNEEWVILSRSTSRREFNDNDVEGLGPWQQGGKHGTVAELKQLEGSTYIQRGIGSTSLSDAPAGMTGKHIRVIYRMPPGSKMIYVDGGPGYGYDGLTSVSGEREVLLPRDSRYKVLEVRESTHNSYNIDVVVELVEQEALN